MDPRRCVSQGRRPHPRHGFAVPTTAVRTIVTSVTNTSHAKPIRSGEADAQFAERAEGDREGVARCHGDAVVAAGRISEDPAATTAFVRSYLATHGAELAVGDRIIAGSMVAPVAVAPGDTLSVSFGPLGELRVGFA